MGICSSTPAKAQVFNENNTKVVQQWSTKFQDVDFITIAGEIENDDAQGIVYAAEGNLSFAAGTAGQLLQKGGMSIQEESKKYIANKGEVKPGGVVITRGGSLKAKWVFHAVIAAPGSPNELEVLRTCVWNCLQEATTLGLSSLSFSPMASGNVLSPAGKDKSQSLAIIVKEVLRFVRENSASSVKTVRFVAAEEKLRVAFKAEVERVIAQKDNISENTQSTEADRPKLDTTYSQLDAHPLEPRKVSKEIVVVQESAPVLVVKEEIIVKEEPVHKEHHEHHNHHHEEKPQEVANQHHHDHEHHHKEEKQEVIEEKTTVIYEQTTQKVVEEVEVVNNQGQVFVEEVEKIIIVDKPIVEIEEKVVDIKETATETIITETVEITVPGLESDLVIKEEIQIVEPKIEIDRVDMDEIKKIDEEVKEEEREIKKEELETKEIEETVKEIIKEEERVIAEEKVLESNLEEQAATGEDALRDAEAFLKAEEKADEYISEIPVPEVTETTEVTTEIISGPEGTEVITTETTDIKVGDEEVIVTTTTVEETVDEN